MPKKSTFTSEYALFRAMLVQEREKAGLTQAEVAARLGKPQSFVSKYEAGQRRLDVIELITIAKVIGFDPVKMVKKLAAG
ncbi:MAG: helix-turn-helix domain-containing protein [Alphaproteobacteria bacterium]